MRCFFRQSPLTGATDEKSRFIGIVNPGLRLLRSLSLGYHITPLQGFRMVEKHFYEGKICCTKNQLNKLGLASVTNCTGCVFG